MPQYKFIHAYPGHFKAGDTATDEQLAASGLSANVLAKDGFISVDGEMVTASTSYTSPTNAAFWKFPKVTPAKPANATDGDH